MAFINRHHALITAVCFAAGLAAAFHFLRFLNERLILFVFFVLLVALFAAYGFRLKIFYGLALLVFFWSGLVLGFNHFSCFARDHLIFQPWSKVSGFSGWIASAEYKKNGQNRYVLQCETIRIDSLKKAATGKVLLWQKEGNFRLKYGQRIFINGSLSLPPLPGNPGEFNFRRYLNFKGIFFQSHITSEQIQILPGRKGIVFQGFVLTPLQNRIRHVIQTNIPEPTSDLAQALILGERQNLDRELYRQFQKTGVVHVLAISGLHVGFVLLLFILLFGMLPVSYRQKYTLAFFFLALFVALVNFKAPVVRASLMAVLYFTLKELQRRPSSLNILGLAALIILLFDPDQLFQQGFQFSFAAVGGILFGYPHLKRMIPFNPKNFLAKKLNRWILQPALVSLAAVLATTPLTWWYYGTIQTGAVLINLFIIPAMGAIVTLSLMLVLLGLAGVPIVQGLGLLIHFIFGFVKKSIAFLAAWPFVQIHTGHPSLIVVLLTALIVFYLYQAHSRSARLNVLLFVSLLVLFTAFKTDKHLRVTFINVGQGDASLIQLPNGAAMLIDGGENRPWLNAGERYVAPLLRYFSVKRLKYALATHAHTDHFGGLITVLQNFTVDTVVVSPYADRTKSYLQFLALAKQKGIPVKQVRRGDRLFPAKNARCYILHPYGDFAKAQKRNGSEVNNSSLVVKLCYGATSFLFTGDAQKEVERTLDAYHEFLTSSVLKAGHHGSATSTTEPFLSLVLPEFTVISVGEKNKFKHPSPVVLSRLKSTHIPALRTDRLGAIVFESDGQEIRLINWRKGLN
ncbi:DNA internalization-related competence protein ComEC/Rec2 [Calditrichota bacterium LG25]